jgi:tryptophan synthase beta chain
VQATDEDALRGAKVLARREGIIPALETAHAVAHLSKMSFSPDDRVVVIISGRGDKDMGTYLEAFGERISDDV